MNEKLLEELKKARYPFQVFVASEHGADRFDSQLEDPKNYLALPTLEELIEACPKEKDGGTLCITSWGDTKDLDKWMASYRKLYPYESDDDLLREDGETPTEAVAKLWLAINKKSNE